MRSIGDRNASDRRGLDCLSICRVVLDDIHLVDVGGDDTTGSARRSANAKDHLPCFVCSTIGSGQRIVCRCHRNRGNAADGLLNQGSEVGVGGVVPRARLLTGSDEFNAKIGGECRGHFIS